MFIDYVVTDLTENELKNQNGGFIPMPYPFYSLINPLSFWNGLKEGWAKSTNI